MGSAMIKCVQNFIYSRYMNKYYIIINNTNPYELLKPTLITKNTTLKHTYGGVL